MTPPDVGSPLSGNGQDPDEQPRWRVGFDSLVSQVSGVDKELGARLRRLSDDLRDGRQAELAHLDLYSVLNPDAIEAKAAIYYQHRPVWISIVEWLRNIFVLLPIAFTWYGLSRAATAYKMLLDGNDELLKQPFLLLWERGFPGLGWNYWPTFSQVALIDFFILLIVVIMTIIVHLFRDYREDEAFREAAALRSRVDRVLGDLGELFAGERFRQGRDQTGAQIGQAMVQFQDRSSHLLRDLGAERERLTSLSAQRETEYSRLHVFTEDLTKGVTDLLSYGRDLRQVYDQLQGSVTEVGKQLGGVAQQQRRLLTALDGIGGHSNTLLETTRVLTQSLETGIRDLQSGASQSAAHAQTIVTAAREMRQVAAAVLDGDTNLRAALTEVRQGNKTIVESLETTTSKLVETTKSTGQAVSLLQQVGAQVVKLGAANDRLATEFGQLVKEQRESNRSVGEAVLSLASSSGQLARAVDALSHENRQLTATITSFDKQWERFITQLEKRVPRATGRNNALWSILAAVLGVLTLSGIGAVLLLILQQVTQK